MLMTGPLREIENALGEVAGQPDLNPDWIPELLATQKRLAELGPGQLLGVKVPILRQSDPDLARAVLDSLRPQKVVLLEHPDYRLVRAVSERGTTIWGRVDRLLGGEKQCRLEAVFL